jgi:predicted GNAT family acetyltransferase
MSATVRNNPDESRYELVIDGEVMGHADYQLGRDGLAVFVHTEVDESLRDQGRAAELVAAALDDVRARGQRVVARCPYVRRFIEQHPAYADLLAA